MYVFKLALQKIKQIVKMYPKLQVKSPKMNMTTCMHGTCT